MNGKKWLRTIVALTVLFCLSATSFAATGEDVKKTPQGITWERIVGKEIMKNDYSLYFKSFISSFNIDSSNKSHMIIGISSTYPFKKQGDELDAGVYESVDAGKTWKFLPNPPDNDPPYFAPFPACIWIKDGRIYAFFFSTGGLFYFEEGQWVFVKSNMDFIRDDLNAKIDSGESGHAITFQPFSDPQHLIAYNPSKVNGLHVDWQDGEQKKSAPVLLPIEGKYAAISKVTRTENATIIYAVIGEKAVENICEKAAVWKAIIPDRILDNPSRLIPLTLKLKLGSKVISISGRETKSLSMDVVPLSLEGRTFIPARFVTEAIGGEITWVQKEKRVDIVKDDHVIRLWLGKSEAEVDGKMVPIDPDNPKIKPLSIPPVDPDNPKIKPLSIPPGRTMVPLRFVSKSLNAEVKWNGDTKEITITSY